ncbi:ABC transporter ATP-binding protein [Saccharicrinis sp. FJH2]|uniref:ABC transporter ATP-binding protein n=1 Tax=unclassified Saccharicrinis TaxID=2646859 RepID=UPI0035D40125
MKIEKALVEIKINNLKKIYPGGFEALKGVNLTIKEGMFGLLGPNGAGKSTLMRILVTLMNPSEGEVLLNGKDLVKQRKEVREMLGYLPQDFRFFAKMKTWEFLDYSARLAGMRNRKERMAKVDEMLGNVGLYEFRNRMANKLSGGMKRRLGIAQALIGEPRIIIVDEPTTGLDPEERIRFRNLLSNIGQGDTIIILSTHIVGDISSTCNQMALLNKGELAFNGAPEDLIEMTKGHVWQIEATQEEYDELKVKYPVISTIPAGSGWELQLVGDDVEAYNPKPVYPNLEHAYVYFMEYKLNNWSL